MRQVLSIGYLINYQKTDGNLLDIIVHRYDSRDPSAIISDHHSATASLANHRLRKEIVRDFFRSDLTSDHLK